MKTKTYKKTSTLFYVFKLHDINGKYQRDCQVSGISEYNARKEVKKQFPNYFNAILKNTNDERVLNAEKYV